MKRLYTIIFILYSVGSSVSCHKQDTFTGLAYPALDSIPFKSGHISIEFAPDLSFISDQFVSGMHFFDELNGVVITTKGEIYKTGDGGMHWKLTYVPINVTTLLQLIFTDKNTGYAVGGKTNPPEGSILKTTNAGETWNKVFTAQDVLFSSIAMNGKGNLFTTTFGNKQQMFKSDDNGTNWNICIDSMIASSFITFNDGRGFCTNTDGTNTIISDDDGATWYEDSLFDSRYTYDMRFKDGVGYCNGYLYLYETHDNGHTWILPALFAGVINSVAPLSDKSCVVFGVGPFRDNDSIPNGIIWQTVNDRTWTGTEFNNVGSIYANSFYTPNNGYASAKKRLLKITIK
ncbi:MAG TPA: YCF48-related protein [Parafilimonas sp.]|nr:YCF48-related protein [Parafilimonas sp.]